MTPIDAGGTDMPEPTPRDELNRRFAGMLSELEDAEVALVSRQAELARQLKDVESELGRLAKVKKVMLGEPTTKAKRAGGAPAPSAKTEENRAKVMEWVRTKRDGSPFSGHDVAVGIGVKAQGLGPILKGLEAAGALEVIGTNDTGRKVYRATATAT